MVWRNPLKRCRSIEEGGTLVKGGRSPIDRRLGGFLLSGVSEPSGGDMVRNQVSARPTERKGSTKSRNGKKNVESSAPRASTPSLVAPKPEIVKAKGELPVPIATYVL